MVLLVGNDFIPNLPHFSVKTLSKVFSNYIDVLPALGGYINEGGELNLKRFEKFMESLAHIDEDHFLQLSKREPIIQPGPSESDDEADDEVDRAEFHLQPETEDLGYDNTDSNSPIFNLHGKRKNSFHLFANNKRPRLDSFEDSATDWDKDSDSDNSNEEVFPNDGDDDKVTHSEPSLNPL